MKTYFVEWTNPDEDIAAIANALGLMIEYAKYLEEESGRATDSHVHTILAENGVQYRMEETSME